MKNSIFILFIFQLCYIASQAQVLSVDIAYNQEKKLVSARLYNDSNEDIIILNGDPAFETIEYSYITISVCKKEFYKEYEEKFPLFEYNHTTKKYKKYRMFYVIHANQSLVLETDVSDLDYITSQSNFFVTVRLVLFNKEAKRIGIPTYEQWITP